MQRLEGWLRGACGDMVEGALTFPIMAMLALALVNLALAGYASVTAMNAADHAARVAAVSQDDPVGRGLAAASKALQAGIGDYTVNVQADTYPGGYVTVRVGWRVPNFYGGLLGVFGVPADRRSHFSGEAVSVQRKEGW